MVEMANKEYASVISGARSGVGPEVGSSTKVTECCSGGWWVSPHNISGTESSSAEEVPSAEVSCAEPRTNPTSTDCAKEIECSADRSICSSRLPSQQDYKQCSPGMVMDQGRC